MAGAPGRRPAAGTAGLADGAAGRCWGLTTLAAGGGAGGAAGAAAAGGLRRNASRRMRFVVVGVTNFAAPLLSRNFASAMIIAIPTRSLSGERAGRNAAERPSPMFWNT